MHDSNLIWLGFVASLLAGLGTAVGALGVFAYLVGHAEFSRYLHIPFIPGAGEVVVFCAALAGAGLGFLWFNAYPAQVFMGDVGALGTDAHQLGVAGAVGLAEGMAAGG